MQVLFLVFLESVDERYLIDELNTVYASCPDWKLDDAIREAVLRTRETNPGLYAALWSQLTPEALVRSDGGLVAIRLAANVARAEDDGFIKGMIEACARGEFGGTTDQLDYAILAAAGLQETPEELLSHYDGVMGGAMPAETSGSSVGTSLAVLLFSKGMNGALSSEEWVARAEVLFDDPRFGVAAAAQVTFQMPEATPPCDLAPEEWQAVRHLANETIDKAGITTR